MNDFLQGPPPEYVANDVVSVAPNFCAKNDAGGTLLTSDAKWQKPAYDVLVVRTFWDYETGQRYVGKLIQADDIAESLAAGKTETSIDDLIARYGADSDPVKNSQAGRSRYDPAMVYFYDSDIIGPSPAAQFFACGFDMRCADEHVVAGRTVLAQKYANGSTVVAMRRPDGKLDFLALTASEANLDAIVERYVNPASDSSSARFFAAFDKAVAAIPAGTREIASERGYEVAHTGGGCMALSRATTNGHLMITRTDGVSIDTDPDHVDWMCGRYGEDGGWISAAEAATLAEAMDMAARLPDPVVALEDGTVEIIEQSYDSIDEAVAKGEEERARIRSAGNAPKP